MPILQFEKPHDGSFDATITRLMGEAFDTACLKLGNISGPARNAVADRIIVAARSGERDPVRLREAGMAALRLLPR